MNFFEIDAERKRLKDYWVDKPGRPYLLMIAAVGDSGQIGLNGYVPWLTPRTPAVKEDLKQFRKTTTGCVVVVGRATWPSVAHLDETYNRSFLIDEADTFIKGNEETAWTFNTPLQVAYERYLDSGGQPKTLHPDLDDSYNPIKNCVVIAGGAKTYRKWIPFVDQIHLTNVEYDGPADTWFPFDALPLDQFKRYADVYNLKRWKENNPAHAENLHASLS